MGEAGAVVSSRQEELEELEELEEAAEAAEAGLEGGEFGEFGELGGIEKTTGLEEDGLGGERVRINGGEEGGAVAGNGMIGGV